MIPTGLSILASMLWLQAGQSLPETLEQARATLREDAAGLLLGILLIAIGSFATLLFCFRWRPKDSTLLSFGLFSGLYGVRLLAERPTMWFLIDAPESFWRQLGAAVTYVILIPASLFFLQTVFKGWGLPVRWIVGAVAVFATWATLSDIWQRTPETAMLANHILVITVVAASLTALFLPRRKVDAEVRALRIGFLTLGVLALHENLVGARLLPDIGSFEPVGFLVLVLCLGFVVARRIFQNQEHLVALQQELRMARRIQSSILPRERPSIPRLDIAVRYVPMTSVGGDFYDFVLVDERHLGLLVADVSGHGVPAALIASMLKMAFRSQFPHASEPAQVLSGLNQVLRLDLQDQFITAAYLFLDVEKRTMSYAAAGHPPLFVWREEDHAVHEIMHNGLVLGPFPQAEYSTARSPFEPGDRCILYTDGILEATNPAQENFGPERLKRFVQSQRHLPAAQFSDLLLAQLSEWRGRESSESPEDDMTLLVVDFKD